MASVIEQTEHRVAIADLKDIDGSDILPQLPEVGVVHTKDDAKQNATNHIMRDESYCLLTMIFHQVINCSRNPLPHILKSLPVREAYLLGALQPLAKELAILRRCLLCRKPLPVAKIDIDNTVQWLHRKSQAAGQALGCHQGSPRGAGIDRFNLPSGEPLRCRFRLSYSSVIKGQVSPTTKPLHPIPFRLPMPYENETGQ